MKRNNEIRSEDNRIKINKFHKDRKKEEKQNVSTSLRFVKQPRNKFISDTKT